MHKKYAYIFIVISLLLGLVCCIFVFLVDEEKQVYSKSFKTKDVAIENYKCFKCHGTHHYEMAKPSNIKKILKGSMPREYIIDSNKYYGSSHGSFRCIDCHSSDYEVAPHDQNLRFEAISSCIDCHDASVDKMWTKFNFATIQSEYIKSVHNIDRFSCWTCHDPHASIMCVRNDSMPLSQVIETSNKMCTKCHSLNDENVYKSHEFFPYPKAHLQQNRCIECHTMKNDSIMVAHNVMDKHKSLRNCSACHSKDSKVVKDFLSKRNSKRNVRESTIVGYYNNWILNIVLISILVVTLLLIIGHIVWSLKHKHDED